MELIELYRGSFNTWECDENDHVNVRFYVARFMESLAILAPHIHLPHAFRANAPSTLQPFDQHIRYMREVHPARPVVVEGGVLEITEDAALLYMEMIHVVTGETAAATRMWVRHAEAKSLKGFAWSNRTRDALEALKVDDPAHTAPRSIPLDPNYRTDDEANLEIAQNIGVPAIGRACVLPSQCDLNGRLIPEMFIGRVSDSVPNLLATWRDDLAKLTAEDESAKIRTGGAVLEYRLIYRNWPKAGDLLEVRTGLGQVREKIHSLFHWILDPVTGKPWCTSEAAAVTFDLDTRKVIPTPKAHMAKLEERAVKGLGL